MDYKGRKLGRPLTKLKKEILNEVLKTKSISLGQPNFDQFIRPSNHPLNLEIGSGSGEFIVNQALENPDKQFLAVEPYVNGLASLALKIHSFDIKNIKIFPDDALKLLNSLPHNSFENIYVLFPDPWPKSRHHKRRIIQKETLDIFSKLLISKGYLWFASDHKEYCRFALLLFQNHSSFDWTAKKPEDWEKKPFSWVDTRYEIKALKSGVSPVFLKFINT